ncbi:hypothetical protein G6F46_005903 [Rhizopus delemar]|uniref:Uncharacterized protein n=2 Tax=Rhizopus TaxID=4842 RepID=A0A9P6YUK8_9FUNG|nr:hypothetical protein G6F36_011256 [Rhizopus arrhizus]KAG1449739.1 hypothetical protein G6F55_010026 [Rhizopus delemar]KAG1492038.1 hypothetical protein G6F54_009595 [Rhizopus delemar]KAG1504122.1 hypothetical protein G6F53_010468 [Rhizopus delemar]KAG1525238.1 hypothetical protein G6F52_003505 [Rhizopus delemar]
MPIVHIMGFDFHLSLLRKVDDFYVLEPVDTVAFPTSHKAIKDNGIQKLISCLEKVKSLCLSQKKANKLMEKAAVRKMVWPSEDEEDEDEDEEDEDDEVEDDNDEDDDQDDDDQDEEE